MVAFATKTTITRMTTTTGENNNKYNNKRGKQRQIQQQQGKTTTNTTTTTGENNNKYNNSSEDISDLLMLMGILASLAAFTMTDTSASDIGLTARISYMASRINLNFSMYVNMNVKPASLECFCTWLIRFPYVRLSDSINSKSRFFESFKYFQSG